MRAFIGSEAVSSGALTAHQLSSQYRRVLPGVYLPKTAVLSTEERTGAAWLWSKRRGVIAGAAASALHGARWVGDDVPIEMNLPNNKSPAGVLTRNESLLDGEIVCRRGMPVTSVERTAFDLARQRPVGRAVARLDALARATGFTAADVCAIADDHPRLRGKRQVPEVLAMVDAGAQSPRETWLRLLLIDAGFPPPTTQIPVFGPDGSPRYYLDLGWEEFLVAAEYDGQHHRTDPAQYRGDVARSEYIAGVGWRRIAVLAGDRGPDIVRRVECAGVPRPFR